MRVAWFPCKVTLIGLCALLLTIAFQDTPSVKLVSVIFECIHARVHLRCRLMMQK